MKRWAILIFSFLATGCGYVNGGDWDDDPKNWERVFHSSQPSDVKVVHSHYWRSRHWSYEAGYLFEIEPNDTLRKQLIEENQLEQRKSSELRKHERPCFAQCPTWFAPKSLDEYEVWSYTNDSHSHFRVLIEKSTRQIFVGDFEI